MRSWSLAVFLLACTPSPEEGIALESEGGVEMPSPSAPLPPPGVSLSGTAPIAGGNVTYRLTGLSQGDQAFFFLSTKNVQQGAGPCPPQLGGICGDLRNPKTLGNDTANVNGVAKVTVSLPAGLQADQLLNVQALVQRPGGAALVSGIWADHVEVDQDQDGVTHVTDCDDTDPTVSPGAAEVCDQRDNNCDGTVDEGCGGPDADGDGFTSPADCDDNDASVYPGANEVCGDQRDNDCDAQIDEGCGGQDADGDGFTTPADCNDNDPRIHPQAAEIAGDNVDQNCDGRVLCYHDLDNDGTRTVTTFLTSVGDTHCTGPGEGATADPIDCDDTDASTSPLAQEVCDQRDNDCDALVDEGCGGGGQDQDGDGFTAQSGDCDDNDASVYPGAPEDCDGRDNDCNGIPDDGCP